MRWQVLLASLAVVVVLVASCSADPIITNGSFETFGTLSGDYLAYGGCAKLDVTLEREVGPGVTPTYSWTTALPG